MRNTKIEWADDSWNTLRGCTRVSQGCVGCYAENISARFSGPGLPYAGLAKQTSAGPRWTGKVKFVEEHLLDPLRWRKPRRIFVNSMSDTFHEAVSDETIDRLFAVMMLAHWHTFIVVTKRHERMRQYMLERWQPAPARTYPPMAGLTKEELTVPAETEGDDRESRVHEAAEEILLGDVGEEDRWWDSEGSPNFRKAPWPLQNVWLLVSVEDQDNANARIPTLLDTPAAVRGISLEPMIGPVDLTNIACSGGTFVNALSGDYWLIDDLGKRSSIDGPTERLDWVVAGGESKTHHLSKPRPWHAKWVDDVARACAQNKTPFFWKQNGEWLFLEKRSNCISRVDSRTIVRLDGETYQGEQLHVWPDGAVSVAVGKKKAGRLFRGQEWTAWPESHLERMEAAQ